MQCSRMDWQIHEYEQLQVQDDISVRSCHEFRLHIQIQQLGQNRSGILYLLTLAFILN